MDSRNTCAAKRRQSNRRRAPSSQTFVKHSLSILPSTESLCSMASSLVDPQVLSKLSQILSNLLLGDNDVRKASVRIPPKRDASTDRSSQC